MHDNDIVCVCEYFPRFHFIRFILFKCSLFYYFNNTEKLTLELFKWTVNSEQKHNGESDRNYIV